MKVALETILYAVDSGVATITLNRPERRNAYTALMRTELIAAFDETDRDPDVRCVIVTGAGAAFCVGADIAEKGAGAFIPTAHTLVENGIARDGAGVLALRMFNSLKPIIGAVNGAAAGAGTSILLPMDVRLAATGAKFGFVFTRRGMTPDGVSAWFLPRLVGISRALEWCCSGRVISADEAHDAGLVRSLHSPDTLMLEARKLALEIAQNTAPVAVSLTRRMMWRFLGYSHPMAAHRVDTRATRSRAASSDPQEGIASFFEKRAPSFRDRVPDDFPDVFPDWVEPDFQ